MSNAINSTHQQDRVAQQKLVNARQHASAQGQQQGTAFSRMLSLVCDEDTDLDALQQAGLGVKADDKDGNVLGKTLSNRKGGKGLPTDGSDDATDRLSPTAQANATLLALLAQAQGSLRDSPPQESTSPSGLPTDHLDEIGATTPDTTTLAQAEAITVADPLAGYATAIGNLVAETPSAATAAPADLAQAALADKPTPGKAVRDLARQLGAAMRQSTGAQDNAPSQTRDGGVAWGRQPAMESTALPNQVGGGLETVSAANTTHGRDSQPLALHTSSVSASETPTGSTDEADTVTDGVAPTELRSSGSEGQSASGLGGEALGGTELAEHKPSAEETQSTADQWRDQWAEAMEQMGQQVSYWVGQGGVRQATLRVGNGWQQPMDVKLSMKNGRAHIEFQTDHEAARSAIAQGGSEVLRELLAQSGIALGEVSIGAQAGGGGGTSADPHHSTHTSGNGSTLNAGTETAPTQATALSPRANHSAGLDLYV